MRRGVESSVCYPVKGVDSARDFPRFPGSSPHCYQSELLGFVTGNRTYLKFVLALQSTDRVCSEARLLPAQVRSTCSFTSPATKGLKGP